MKQQIQTCIFLFLVFTGTLLKAQEMNANKQSAANAYANYLNETSHDLSRLMVQLKDYYLKAENYRQGKSYNSPERFTFRFEISEHLLENVNKKKNGLFPGERKSIETDFKAIIKIDNQLVKNLQDLQVYLKLKDFEFDEFAYSDSMLSAIRKQFLKRADLNNKVADNLMNLWYTAYKNNSGPYIKAAKIMRQVLVDERKLHQGWFYNLSYKTPTQHFPFEKIAQSYANYHASKFPDLSALQHPASFYYRCLTGSSYQAQKAYMLNNYTRKNCSSDGHNNRSYRTLLNYFNNDLIIDFNNYCDAVKQYGIYLNYAVRSSPCFKIDNVAVLYQSALIQANTSQLISPPGISGKKAMPVKLKVEALNTYQKYVNEEIRKSNNYTEHIFRYNKNLNEYLKGESKYGPSSFHSFDNYDIPFAVFYQAKGKGNFLEKEIQDYCNRVIDKLHAISQERRQLIFALHKYSVRDDYKKDQGKKAIAFFQRFQELYHAFDKQKRSFSTVLQNYYNAWQPNTENSWYKSAVAMKKIVDEDRKLMYAVDGKFINPDTAMPLVLPVKNAARECISNLYTNLQGIDKLGRHHGHCPYTPYEDVAQESIDFALEVSKIDEKITKTRDIADEQNDYIRSFNDIIEEYNDFVWLAGADYEEVHYHKAPRYYLLREAKHVFSYRYTPPESIPDDEDIEIDTDVFTSMEGFAHNNLVLLLDISGSMNDDNKLPLLKKSFSQLLKIMRPQDYVAIVTYSGRARQVLMPTSCNESRKIRKVLKNLKSGGSTNITQGINLAYQTAEENFIPKGNNRIILATDGQFSIGDYTTATIEEGVEKGINLSVFYFSDSNKNNRTLKKIAKRGNGLYTKIKPDNINQTLVKEVQAITRK